MPEPFSTEHLNQLRQRWERDPKSRAFLQLAEEYRRAGRLPDAVHVLEIGLKEHPTYLSAQVALGRCQIESGAPGAAAEVLERAVARDPTQLVANKLLVEAYLVQGQAAKAQERLNLYKLFNDRDVEIEALEARIRALGSPAGVARAAMKTAPGEGRYGAPFELPVPESLPDVHLEPALASRHLGADATTLSEPFGVLYPPDAGGRIDTALAEQAIFALAPQMPESLADPAVAEPVSARWEAESWPAGSAQIEEPNPEPGPIPAAFLPTRTTVDGFVLPDSAADAPPEPQPLSPPPMSMSQATPAASATLGELYLAQGHLDEAEESFQSVLRSRPSDTAALAGLESVRFQRGEEAAVFADDVVAAGESNHIVGGLTARKASLLKDYLARIRRGAKRHVS